MVQEENGENKIDRETNEQVLDRIGEKRTLLSNILRRKANWIGHSLYRSSNIVLMIKSRRLRWTEYASVVENGRSASEILTGEPTGKRPLERLSRRRDDIRIDQKKQ